MDRSGQTQSMKIEMTEQTNTKQKPAKAKPVKQTKTKPAKQAKTKQAKTKPAKKEEPKQDTTNKHGRIVTVHTNNKQKLTEMELMRSHNFMSKTEATLTRMYNMTPLGNHKYEIDDTETCVSAILKLVLKIDQTNPMTMDWSLILWNITQKAILPDNVMVTFVRHFERVDNVIAEKGIKRRKNLAILSSDNGKNKKSQGIFVRHDAGLLNAIESGDCVVAFGAEAIITAPDEIILEEALTLVKNYLKSNDETRGLSWELDINWQLRPFVLFGPNTVSKNKDVFVNMSSSDAAISSLFVDSGGDRVPGSEYIGMSVGKMISSYAAYKLVNKRTLIVGNDTVNRTYTMLKTMPKDLAKLPSQIYWSQAISRAYLLNGHSVTHFVLDNVDNVDNLMSIALSDKNKLSLDVSKGLLNILEVVDNTDFSQYPERIVGRFATHINNIIALLTQYRDKDTISTTDDFASITRSILTDFFVANKYYSHNPLEHLEDIRLVGIHDQYKTLADLGGWIAQRRKSNKDPHLDAALNELNNIINENILPTIPSLNTKTQPIIDDLIEKKYRVLDLTGMNIGSIQAGNDSTTNVMMMSYLNLILPILKNGDVIFIHGFARVSKIAKLVQEMITNCGLRVDVVFTESNQNQAVNSMKIIEDNIDLAVVDLYKNDTNKLADVLAIDKSFSDSLYESPGAFYIETKMSSDYVFLDNIL